MRKRREPSSERFRLRFTERGERHVDVTDVEVDHPVAGNVRGFARDVAGGFAVSDDVEPLGPDQVMGHVLLSVNSCTTDDTDENRDDTEKARVTQKDERWSSYPETVLYFAGDPEVMVDLRVPLEPAVRRGLAAIGLDGKFAVLTAFNPRGVDIGEAENNRRMKELEAELESSGDEFVRVDACSPDRSHCECSVALKGDLDRAIDIAKRWEQIAIFSFDGSSSFWIYGATELIEPIKLPVS